MKVGEGAQGHQPFDEWTVGFVALELEIAVDGNATVVTTEGGEVALSLQFRFLGGPLQPVLGKVHSVRMQLLNPPFAEMAASQGNSMAELRKLSVPRESLPSAHICDFFTNDSMSSSPTPTRDCKWGYMNHSTYMSRVSNPKNYSNCKDPQHIVCF
jgi:hypothetical protein